MGNLPKFKISVLSLGMACLINPALAFDFNSHVAEKILATYNDTSRFHYVRNNALFLEGWHSVPQARFWQNVLKLSSDSVILNTPRNRQPLQIISAEEWNCQQDSEKEAYRSFLRNRFNLSPNEPIYVTTGKKDFYEFRKVIPMISKAVDVFRNAGVDPWYAQTILLIESPGKMNTRSYAGANGPFQLMRSVARKYGLKVGNGIDERTDLSKSALAAAKLLNTACIPGIKAILDERNIAYNETDLWFRLLVMHAYHAGTGNVSCIMSKIDPQQAGLELFKEIWTNECGGFRNESQNYSQLALAAIIHFENILTAEKDTVFLVSGDRMMSNYNRTSNDINYLEKCLDAYEEDLIDGIIPFEYFYKKITLLNRELASAKSKIQNPAGQATVKNNSQRDSYQFVKLGDQLIRKRNLETAIKVLKYSVEKNPDSALAYDSLGRAYRLMGKKELALKYSNKSASLKNKAMD